MTKLDYSIESPEERKALVEQILTEVSDPSPQYLEILANYLIISIEKQEKKQNKKIITENRLVTINKRELSFEGLMSQFESGEDGVYSLMTPIKDKNILFQPKISITQEDLDEMPELRQLKEAIKLWDEKLKTTEGKDAYIIKKGLIEMRKDQYVIKQALKPQVNTRQITTNKYYAALEDWTTVNKKGECRPYGVTCVDPRICQTTLCNYVRLKQACQGKFEADLWYFMYDFDILMDKALKNYPMYQELVKCKIQGLSNEETQSAIREKFGKSHTIEYISSLWRHKIPKMIASVAEDNYLDWYYLNVAPGTYKKCSCCGQIKLAHNKYFSRNRTSKDGFYSLCKVCRNRRAREKYNRERKDNHNG